jgi:leucyl/phenylalanyl-tRNA--protein transferase
VTSPFGQPTDWPDDDLIAYSDIFDPELTVQAYRHGVFPMPIGPAMGWYSPRIRGVLPLPELKVSRSLRKMAKRYEVRFDTAYEAVVAGCGDPSRPSGWIDDEIKQVYRRLHAAGFVHSVEAWTPDGELAGGLYGVSIGGLFAGESMFHRPDIGRDASKAALIGLVGLLTAAGPDGAHEGRLLDVQWRTEHLESLGVVEVARETYLEG